MANEEKTPDEKLDDLTDLLTDFSGRLDLLEKPPKDPDPDPDPDPNDDDTSVPGWAVKIQTDLDSIKGREDVKEEKRSQRKGRRTAYRKAIQKRKTNQTEASRIEKEKRKGSRIFRN